MLLLNSQGILHHFTQSLMPGLSVDVKAMNLLDSKELISYNVIYLDTGLTDDEIFKGVKEKLIEFTQQGGTLFLSNEYAAHFPKEFLGIQSISKVDTKEMNFTYPEVSENLRSLQSIWKSFAEDYILFQKANASRPKLLIDYDQAVVVDQAAPIAVQDGLAYFIANRVGNGHVLWSNTFLPNKAYITLFDLQPEDEQKYFHFGYATANYMFRNELLDFAAKEKYGFSIKKAYGPYGRPGLAWQNHYEQLYSANILDLVKWTDILEKYNQIPTFSLARGMYNGGQWHSNIAYHLNEGSNEQPIFRGEQENSFFTSGEKVKLKDDYLKFTRYPGYTGLLSKIDLPQRAFPQWVDWNEDGKQDIIAGTWEGEIYFIENIGDIGKPRFEEKVNLYADGRKIFVKENSAAPFVFDYNGDGLQDLIIGDRSGSIHVFINEGTKKRDKFESAGLLKAGDAALRVNGEAAPFAEDWDGDSVTDLLVGSGDGKVLLFKGSLRDGQWLFSENGAPFRRQTGK
jgi:hypothetical protein